MQANRGDSNETSNFAQESGGLGCCCALAVASCECRPNRGRTARFGDGRVAVRANRSRRRTQGRRAETQPRQSRDNLFSDRPQRIVGHEPTEDFVAQWAVGEDSFAADPPNAALSILTGTEPQEIILELMNPRIEGGDLVYDVKVLQGNEKATGESVSLFIDPHWPSHVSRLDCRCSPAHAPVGHSSHSALTPTWQSTAQAF